MSRLERKNAFFKKLAILVIFNMVFEIVAPTVVLALTSGPSSPEFSSFEPVATNNMVDPFSGDFTYNLPVLMVPGTNGGGYPISLSYHSGTTGEQEASWVGHGWSLNPGAINRGKQGFPDDWNGEKVLNHNKAIPNKTVTLGVNAEFEAFSANTKIKPKAALTYNNYKGLGYSLGTSLSLSKGLVSLGFNVKDGKHAFSLKVSPYKLLNRSKKETKKKKLEIEDKLIGANATEEKRLKKKLTRLDNKLTKKDRKIPSSVGGVYGVLSLAGGQRPNQFSEYNGAALNFSLKFMTAPTFLPAGPEYGVFGSVAIQKNKPIKTNYAFGNHYNSEAYADADNLMDYYTEKDHPYENNDVYLGIPHALTDQYMVTGEGIAGAFRMHHKTVGQFRPNKVSSEIVIGNVGFEYGGGLNIDYGSDAGLGYHVYKQKAWELYDGVEQYSDENKGIFRFTNDLGGSVEFDGDDTKESALLHKNSGIPGFKKYTANTQYIDQDVNTNLAVASDYGIGASSYIGHNTFAQKNLTSGVVHYRAYEKSDHIENFVNYADPNTADQIAEVSVKNKSGERYNYGLPVFAREEKEISIGLTKVYPKPTVQNGYLTYTDADISSASKREKLKIIQGQERDAPYVTSYLLTSIEEPNYIDRTNDGPTEDDFGGYTKFNYKQEWGSDPTNGEGKTKLTDGDWYQWRFPYTGLYYNRGRLSNKKDDMGSYSSGEKEVYYMESIETKTHIAVFETSDRMDGLSANDDPTVASTDETANGNKKLQKLDKIELFVKDETWDAYVADPINNPKPDALKTVNFEYDYSIVPGIPNSDNNEGKLTLKRVWFDYDGVYKAQISPYEFEYNYPEYANYPAKYTAGDDDVTAGYVNFNGAAIEAENPAYDEQQLNAWGYNQGTIVGQNAHDDMKTWVDQTLENGEDIPTGVGDQPYDPAAWNLKVIKLPSGGEIHVQYEQDDYQYVQNKVAHVMVPLTPDSNDSNSPRYYLDTDAINVTTAAERAALVDAIRKRYITEGKKIYFKFLYAMTSLNITPSIDDCDVEYIKGYTKVKSSGVATVGGIERVYIELSTGQPDRFDLPKKVCKEYDKAYLSGKSLNDNCGIDGDLTYGNDDPEGFLANILNLLPNIPTPGVSLGCASVDWDHSFFRVPCIKPKKGGGLRVKRLMMYTPALHAGEEPELYGTEYVYQFIDNDGKIKSSGVATNEPTSIREENILVDNIDRLPKNEWDKLRDKIVAGKEKEKFEGPIGESLYGSASVGYSQIITKNIHSGETNTGYNVSQFYTCKDFPLVSDYTDLAGNTKNDYLPIPALYVNHTTNNVWAAQGYNFTINNMHGQIKRAAVFTGDYDNIFDLSSGNLVSATEYDYFEMGESVPVMNSLEEIVDLPLGKESELYMESRSVTDHLHDVSVEWDLSVATTPIPLLFGSLFPSYTHIETELHTHVTNKITRYPAMVQSVRNYTDGIWSKTEHLAFNSQTGDPLVTRTYDDFNESNEANQFEIDNVDHHGWFTSYSIPAYQKYANMGQVALSEGKVFGTGVGFKIDKNVDVGGNVTLSFSNDVGPVDVCQALSQLNTGDLINMTGGQFHVTAINGSVVELEPTYYNTSTQTAATDISFLVVRSGRTNQAGAAVGSFVTYGKPLTVDAILPTISYTAIDDPAHPNYAAYSDRVTIMNLLNTLLANGGGSDVIDPEIIHLIGTSHCAEVETEIYMIISGGTIQVVLHGDGIGECGMLLTEIEEAEFQIDTESGALFYGSLGGECDPQSLDCIVFCQSLYPVRTVDKVVTANATTLSDDWDYDETAYDNGITNYNPFELAKRGKWRVKSSYAFKAATTGLEQRFNPFTSATSDEEFNYNSGLFTLALFNWKYEDANDPKTWLKATTITKYDPNGNALEEQNILGIKSTVKFGYHQYLPYLTASNSPYGSVAFESFENTYSTALGTVVEENTLVLAGTNVVDEESHTGYASLKFASGTTAPFFTTNEMDFTDQIANVGLHTKLWIKNVDESTEDIQVTIKDVDSPSELYGNLNKVAQTGEWTLYELNYSDWGVFNPERFTISFNIENSASGKNFYVDDLRIQPLDAEMICYVYDYKNYRLMATFDDQHFSMRYQYNDEGQLIRKQIETTRGIKTVTDGQYNTPLKNRTN